MKLKYVSLLILFLPLFVTAQMSKDQFKKKFEEATELMNQEQYSKALPIWLELEKEEPNNANLQFSIGNCYLNSKFDKDKSIEFFERAEDKLVAYYKVGDYKEKAAPLEAIHHLGKAYHVNYRFEDALEKYFEYKELIFSTNEEYLKKIDRDIEITKNAMRAMEDPVDITVRQAYDMNTEWPEYRPVVNADETVMIFTARRDDSEGGEVDHEGKYYEDLYISYKVKGIWSKPFTLGKSINTASHEATMYLSPSGDHMFLYKYEEEGDLGGSIYETYLDGTVWTEPSLVEGGVNSSAWETHANLSADGKIMVFTSDREGTLGGRDIWFMNKLDDGTWAQPQNIGDMINTEYEEESPYLHPDGKSLYFSSSGHNTMGGFDVFKSELQADGTWGKPVNMGYPINTTGDDVFFIPTTNGKRAYFSSYREGGMGDLDVYIMELNDEGEKSLTIYKGLAHDINGNVVKNLVISVYDEETDDLFGVYRPNPITGKFMFILRPGHTYEIEYEVDGIVQSEFIEVKDDGGVQQVGRLIVKENDKITINASDAEDIDIQEVARVKEATALEVIELDVKLNTTVDVVDDKVKTEQEKMISENIKEMLNSGGAVVLDNILFEYNKHSLTEESKEIIDFLVEYMKEMTDKKVEISGHTDAIGSDEYNQSLSEKRAKSVRNYMREAGISKSRMKYVGYGEAKPVAPNTHPNGDDNPEGRQRNRRVEFKVIE